VVGSKVAALGVDRPFCLCLFLVLFLFRLAATAANDDAEKTAETDEDSPRLTSQKPIFTTTPSRTSPRAQPRPRLPHSPNQTLCAAHSTDTGPLSSRRSSLPPQPQPNLLQFTPAPPLPPPAPLALHVAYDAIANS